MALFDSAFGWFGFRSFLTNGKQNHMETVPPPTVSLVYTALLYRWTVNTVSNDLFLIRNSNFRKARVPYARNRCLSKHQTGFAVDSLSDEGESCAAP